MVGKCVFAGPTVTPLSRAASLREILALDVRDLLHPDFREFVQPRINLVYGRKYKKFQEIKIIRLDGHPADVEIMALAINYQGLPALQVVLRDMTPRQLAGQEELQDRLPAAEHGRYQAQSLAQQLLISLPAPEGYAATQRG